MARSSVLTDDTTARPHVRGANGRGRAPAQAPARDEDEDLATGIEPEEALEESAAPDSSQVFKGKGEDLFQWLTQFTTDDWNLMTAYLYRTQPIIDRKSGGRATNLRKYADAFDAERIMREFGSGGYRVDVVRRNSISGKSVRVGQAYFSVMNLDFPPRVPAGDWVDDPENKMWEWAKPALQRAEAAGIYGAPMHEDPNKMFNTVLEGIKSLHSIGSPQDGGVAAAAISGMTTLTAKLMDRASAPASQDETLKFMLTFLQTQMASQNEELRMLREKLFLTPAKGILEQLKDALPVFAELKDFIGAKGGRTAPTNWGDVVTGVIDKLSDHAPTILQALSARPPGPGAFQLNQPSLRPAAPAPAETAPAGQTQQPQENPNRMPDEKKRRFNEILAQWGNKIQAVAPILIDHFQANLTGYEFRDWFISRKGLEEYNAFTKKDGHPTAQELTEMSQLHTVLAAALQPPDKLLIFFEEFFIAQGEEPPGAVVEDEPNADAGAE